MTEYLDTPQGRRIAYNLTTGQGPTIVFCGGLKSDKEGTKAIYLEDWAKSTGRAFLRFDYSGHGMSSEKFEDGCIGDWFEDACAAIDLVDGPVVLVGSSMGGWQSLLLARERAERVAGLVTIAGAPDFTEDGYWASFTDAQKAELDSRGYVEIPNEYVEPYIITKRLIEDGRNRLILRTPLNLPFPTRILQGEADDVVTTDVALALFNHATGPDIDLTIVKGADHRFSDEKCLKLIKAAVENVLESA